MPKSGFISCSQLSKLMVATDLKKNTFGDGAMTYAMQLAAERLGVTEFPEAYGHAIDWGNENEFIAKRVYEDKKLTEIEQAMFIVHPTIKNFGGTPDGLIGMRGGIEIKCPHNPTNHMKNILTGEQFDTDYKPQIQGYLLLTGREWWDAASFDPRFPDELQLAVKRMKPDEEYQAILKARIIAFDAIVDSIVQSAKESDLIK